MAVCAVFGSFTGCAFGRTTMTFEEAGFRPDEGADDPPPLQATPPAPATPAATVDGPEARRIDNALLAFATRERLLRASVTDNKLFSADAERNWKMVFKEVDDFLRSDASHTPALELTRAYVTLDAEMEMDQRTWKAIPELVADGSMDRRHRVRERLALVRARPVNRTPTDLSWPISPPLVTSLFGDRVDPFTGDWGVHRGVDIAAQKGQLIIASAPGVVSVAQWVAGHGLHVEIAHDGGMVTRYSHLSMVLTTPGTHVDRGDPIGLAGTTGRSTGPHLHFEVWRDGRPVDPLSLLGDPGVDLTAGTPVQRSARRGPGPRSARD